MPTGKFGQFRVTGKPTALLLKKKTISLLGKGIMLVGSVACMGGRLSGMRLAGARYVYSVFDIQPTDHSLN